MFGLLNEVIYLHSFRRIVKIFVKYNDVGG
jgi:hypothetical protein